MKKVALLPLRAGSKSIIGKNKKKLLGRPLFSWCLTEAIFSSLDEIYVFTDDEDIIDYVYNEYRHTNKVKIMRRSQQSATDTASTEVAMHEFTQKIEGDYDILCLLQATSPLTTRTDIDLCLQKVEQESFDSALTTVRLKRFIWDEMGRSINYNYKNRPRRQDFDGFLVENGAVYVTTKEVFEKTGIRIGGNIATVEMPEDTFIEIDNPSDWEQIIPLLKRRLMKNKREPKMIKAMVFDVDGVMTDGSVITSAHGELGKSFSLRDGMGIQLLKENGIIPVIITSEKSEIVQQRIRKLKIDNAYFGVQDKYFILQKILVDMGLERREIAYVGDDINDHANLCSVGWGIVPNNAEDEVKIDADIILRASGGENAVREAINIILNYNNRFTI